MSDEKLEVSFLKSPDGEFDIFTLKRDSKGVIHGYGNIIGRIYSERYASMVVEALNKLNGISD